MVAAKYVSGYVPPESFAFKSVAEAIGHIVAAICSPQCARFMEYVVDTHPARDNDEMAQFLPPYTLADWSAGNIDEVVWKGREPGAKESLRRWASAMVEFNTFFHGEGIDNATEFVESGGYIVKSTKHYGWDPNWPVIRTKLAELNLEAVDPTSFIQQKKSSPGAATSIPVEEEEKEESSADAPIFEAEGGGHRMP
jgi:hypothetical protein